MRGAPETMENLEQISRILVLKVVSIFSIPFWLVPFTCPVQAAPAGTIKRKMNATRIKVCHFSKANLLFLFPDLFRTTSKSTTGTLYGMFCMLRLSNLTMSDPALTILSHIMLLLDRWYRLAVHI